MALVTISLDAEDGRTVMANAAGSPFFHLGHGYPFIIGPGVIGLVMTISAGVDIQVLVMIEAGIIGKENFFDRMASAATFDTEGGLAIMTRTARPALIHIRHAVTPGSAS